MSSVNKDSIAIAAMLYAKEKGYSQYQTISSWIAAIEWYNNQNK